MRSGEAGIHRRRQLRWLATTFVMPVLVLVACSPGKPPVDEETASLRAQAEAFAEALTDGDAEKALTAVGVERESLSCPELFSPDVYRTVSDRPTDVRVEATAVSQESLHEAGGATTGLVTLTYEMAGVETEQVFEMTLAGTTWRAEVFGLLSPFGLIAVERPGVGAFEIAGQCGQGVGDGQEEIAVLPGRYAIAYVDPSQIMTASGVEVVVQGGAQSQGSSDALRATTDVEDTRADFLLVPADGVTMGLVALLDDEATLCAADALTGPHCGYGPPQNDAAGGHLSDVHTSSGSTDLPGPQIAGKDGAWRFLAHPTLCIEYTVGSTTRCDLVTYAGTVSRDSSGKLAVTLDQPFVSPGLAP